MINFVSESIINKERSHFKEGYSLGYVFRNIESNVLRYYHSSSNNSVVLDTARLVSNRQDLIAFLNNIVEEKLGYMLSRADPKWVNVKITNAVFNVSKLRDAPLESRVELPKFVEFNRSIVNFRGNDRCFFLLFVSFLGVVNSEANAMQTSCFMLCD